MKEKTSLMPNAHPQLPPIDTPLTPIGEKIKIRFGILFTLRGLNASNLVTIWDFKQFLLSESEIEKKK